MPFSATTSKSEEEWGKIYNNLFKRIIENSKFDYECKRSELENGSFTRDIVINLKDDYLVLADITDFNPNVMWELGVRHSLSKKTIMVARSDFIPKIPSDIKEYGVVPYDVGITDYKEFEEQIYSIMKKIEDNPEKPDSPVFNFLKEEDLILSSYGRKQIINKLVGLMTEIGENLELVNGILSKTKPVEKMGVTSRRCAFQALDKLLIENYVNAGEGYIKLLQRIRKWIVAINHRLNRLLAVDKKYRKEVIDAIFDDAQELKTMLTKSMHDTRDLYRSVKSNSLNDVEPSIIISDELSEEFFK